MPSPPSLSPSHLTFVMRRLLAAVGCLVLTAGGVAAETPSSVPAPVTAGVAAVRPAGAPVVLARDRRRMNQRVFDRVWSEVRRDYYDPQLHGIDWRAARATYRPQAVAARDDRELYLVLERMLDLLDDDHASAVSPAAARRQDTLRRRRAVIGVSMFAEGEGVYRIERVRAGSPAADAGVTVGWRLQARDSDGWTPERDVVDGEPVTLRFSDPAGALREVTVVPREMAPQPAFVADRSRDGVLVLRVEGFEAGLGHWMGGQLAELPADTDVIVDLRANPGGLLREADAVLSCFLPPDRQWATRTARSGRAIVMRIAPACGDLAAPVPNDLAVLVDSASRSAAELTPAALQEAHRALVVGERTAGAVLISQDTPLPDGGRLSLSRADFVTAGGVRLEKNGLAPDIEVAAGADPAVTESALDPALATAIAALATVRQARTAASSGS